MKYFNHITTADELKKQFRAYCVTMHPDKGGDAEEFKKMVDEYNRINADFDRIKEQQAEEEEARRQAEEWRKEEEERKRKEEEEARKAVTKMEKVIAKWSGKLKKVTGLDDGRSYGHTAAYYAAVKHNIKVIFNTYFPGVNVKVSFKTSGWCEGADLIWFDGPSVEQVNSIKELHYFISWCHFCSPYEDYGHDERIKEHVAWVEEFGEIGRAQSYSYDRRFSDLAKAEIRLKIIELFPQFATVDESGKAFIEENEAHKIGDFLNLDFNDYHTSSDYRDISYNGHLGKDTSYNELFRCFRQHYAISEETTQAAEAAANAPKFLPNHCKVWKAIKKALGSNVFGVSADGRCHYNEVSINEVAELLAKDVKVYLVKPSIFDGEPVYYGVNGGGAKVQRKRAEKFAAVGVTISNTGYNSYKDVEVLQFSAQVIEDLRKDAEDVEAQRKAWEEAQKTGKASRKSNRTANTAKTDNTDKAETTDHATATDAAEDTAAPAEGLELVEILGGVAVVGDSHTTFRNRKHIKAHGATWNKEAQQWQATDPDKVAQLRAWFGVEDAADTNTNDRTEEQPAAQDAAEQSTAEDSTEATATAQADPIAAESVATLAAALESICQALTDAATAAKVEATKTAEQARKHTEAEQLRQDIANISAQVAQMSDTLNKMLARLAALEADTDTAPDEQPQAGKPGKSYDELAMLRAACEDADKRTQNGEHIEAVLARLYALAACGVMVRDLIKQAQALDYKAAEQGVTTPTDYEQAQQIAAEGRKRAAAFLSDAAVLALYGETPGTQAAA